jgi:AraC family transcriptional activator of pobA
MKDIPVRKIKTRQQLPNLPGDFSIRDVKGLLAGQDLVHDLHRHDFFFILALQKGAGIHEIDFVHYTVHDNTVFILRPGQVHKLELKRTCTGFLLEFAPGFYQPIDLPSIQRLRQAGRANYFEMEATRSRKIFSLLSGILDEYTEKQEGYLEVIKANLGVFFIEFTRQSQNGGKSSTEAAAYSQERLEEFLDLLRTHLVTHKKVSQYANLLNLSPYQLNAISKAMVGKPASALINEQILLEAKRQLLATTQQVKHIADHLGYEDISYFSRFFKKHTGYSPEAFRMNFR